jgi:hypothetical protein
MSQGVLELRSPRYTFKNGMVCSNKAKATKYSRLNEVRNAKCACEENYCSALLEYNFWGQRNRAIGVVTLGWSGSASLIVHTLQLESSDEAPTALRNMAMEIDFHFVLRVMVELRLSIRDR